MSQTTHNRSVPRSEPVRRRQAGLLIVGAAEPEIQPWLHAAGHAVRAVRTVKAAGEALEQDPVDLVIVDRDPSGLDAPAVARKLPENPRLGDAWVLVITGQATGRIADATLNAGADDYLPRPFTRAELLARARAGLRAAQQRSNDALLRALMVNVPGAIYRTAWHADGAVELISDEIERISGHPQESFVASNRRTLVGLVHREDRARLREAIDEAAELEEPYSLEYRIVRSDGAVRWVLDRGQPVPGPGGRVWLDGALFDITERKEAEDALLRREVEAARTAELHASRARIVQAADNARRKIERDLHDGAQQRLVAMSLGRQVARRAVAHDPSPPGPLLGRLGGGARAPPRRRPGPERRRAAAGAAGGGAPGRVGRAAGAGPRHPPGRADRARARGGHRRTGHARPRAGRGGGGARGPLAALDRGHGLLHGLRGADQRGQVRPGQPRPG